MISDQLKLEKLPIYSACYCGDCKRPLPEAHIIDDKNAWCPECNCVVTKSHFQIKSWLVGVTVLLYTLMIMLILNH